MIYVYGWDGMDGWMGSDGWMDGCDGMGWMGLLSYVIGLQSTLGANK